MRTSKATEPRSRASLASPPLILLVETDVATRLHAANEMLDEGYEVVESDSALEATSILRGRNDFDAIIVDVSRDQGPGGLALLRYVATSHGEMDILVASDATDGPSEAEAVGAEYLAKPYANGALVSRMGLLLARRTQVVEARIRRRSLRQRNDGGEPF